MPTSPGLTASDLDPRELNIEEEDLDLAAAHYVTQYSATELRTFHCDRVRKMPLSGLDPSMLLGFLCKDENDWVDLRRRVNELNHRHRTIFTIQDEPPSWPSDCDEFMGLESIDEPDDLEMDLEDDPSEEETNINKSEDRPDNDDFFDTRSTSVSPVESSVKGGAKGSEADTEDDPIGPITPGPNSAFEVDKLDENGLSKNDDFEEINGDDEDDDEWVDPSMPTPLAKPADRPFARPMQQTKSTGSSRSLEKGKKGKKKKTIPVVKVPSPPLRTEEHFPFPRAPGESLYEQTDGGGFEKRMNNARARDGGRTESGGVKAVLTDDVTPR